MVEDLNTLGSFVVQGLRISTHTWEFCGPVVADLKQTLGGFVDQWLRISTDAWRFCGPVVEDLNTHLGVLWSSG